MVDKVYTSYIQYTYKLPTGHLVHVSSSLFLKSAHSIPPKKKNIFVKSISDYVHVILALIFIDT